MNWPSLCVDNFFRSPDSVIEWSKTLKYYNTNGTYPGKRTEALHTIENNFFQNTTQKIIASLYPNEATSTSLSWKAEQFFQKINTKKHKLPGFVHQDINSLFTCIIYLTDEEETGTCLYKRIKEPNPNYDNIKIKGYKNLNFTKEFTESLKLNRKNHKKIFEFVASKNRMVLFDSSHYHGVDYFGLKKTERLTLITFFTDIWRIDGTTLKYHVNECTRL
jgi:hypothetical protein